MKNAVQWKRENVDVFWGEIAPHDHVMQVYENDDVFLDALAGFVGGGIKGGECVIVIASGKHLQDLHDRLSSYVIGVNTLVDDARYLPLNAEETLAKFMINGWPDEKLFNETISSVVNAGTEKCRKIRAFGEMVAITWEKGNYEATLELERLWNKFTAQNKMTLFCAYPEKIVHDNKKEFRHICGCHTKMIDGREKQLAEVTYRELQLPAA